MPPSTDHVQSLHDALAGRTELRPFPAVASQILTICNKPNIHPQDLSRVIQCDPAVALRLLRVANSSMYGFSGEIRSIDHAIVVLGFRTVRDLVISAAVADMFSANDSAKTALEELWQHSLACASIARKLAGLVEVAPEEAFLAGIVHDVGKLIFFDVVAEAYIEIDRQADSRTIVQLEESEFGMNHQRLGQRCAEEWGLPGEIDAAIGFHHQPESAMFAAQLVAVICVADSLARVWHLGSHGSEDELPSALQRASLSISPAQIAEIQTQAVSDYEVLQEACRS